MRHDRYRRLICFCIVILFLWLGTSCARLRLAQTAAPPCEEPPKLPPLSEAAQKRAEAYALYSFGLSLEHQNDMAGALSNYQRAAELDPDNEPLQLRIAVMLLQEKRTQEAISLLERLVASPKVSDRPLMLLGTVYEATGDFKAAETIYRRLLEAYPDRQEIYANLARLYLKQEDAESALNLLSEGIDKAQDPSELLILVVALQITRAEQSQDPVPYYRKAVEALEKLQKQRPNDIRLKMQLAELCLRAEDYEKALAIFESLEQAIGDPSESFVRLAKMLAAARDKDKILDALERAAIKASNNVERIYYYMGAVFEAKGRTDKALEYYERSTTGKHAQVAAYVALAAMQSTNLAQATATIAKGLEQFPEHPLLLNVMANVLFLREEYSSAVTYFDRALNAAAQARQAIRNPSYFLNYAIALQKTGNLEAAANRLREGLELKPDLLESYLQFAFQQTNTIAQKESVAVLEKLGELQPSEPDALLYAAVLNLYFKSYDEALKTFKKIERLIRDTGQNEEKLNAQFYFWYGSAAERSGDFPLAEKLFLKCIELDPQHAEALNYIAYLWAERGVELDRALEFATRALAIQPESGAFLDTLGWIYYMQGNYTQALAEVNRAAELIPEDPTVMEHLGDIFEKIGNEEMALPHWKRAFVLDPSNEKLKQKLADRGVDLEELLKKQAIHLEKGKEAPPANERKLAPSTLQLSIPSENESDSLSPDSNAEEGE